VTKATKKFPTQKLLLYVFAVIGFGVVGLLLGSYIGGGLHISFGSSQQQDASPNAEKTAAKAADKLDTYDRIVKSGTIVCGYFPWPGFAEKNVNTGELSGIQIDAVNQAFATLDLKVEWKEVIIGAQVEDLTNGKVDAVCLDAPFVMSAGKFVEYSNPFYGSKAVVYARTDEQRFTKLSDLNNETVRFSGIDGDFSMDLAQRLFPKAKMISMPGTTDPTQLFVNLTTRKADVLLTDPMSFQLFEKSNPNQLKGLFAGKAIGVYKIVASVRKGDFKTLGLINQAIDNAASFGITDAVLNKFDPDLRFMQRVRSPYID
jgi:ABC-type amino acid transport substrate-binding protein